MRESTLKTRENDPPHDSPGASGGRIAELKGKQSSEDASHWGA